MLGNTLRAPELLRNKGIRFETWEKWDKISETLPSKGQKQFQPSNSWLQQKQIEEGLKNRKNLLGIERVERSSQLAVAEWLSQESRAVVTKKSGQEWTNFGYEENSRFYLIPEEALLLVELNCLELTWKGLALSVQQAYAALLESDRSECSIEEYRVYSHLARQGYRLQRFRYQGDSARRDTASLKRKKGIQCPRTVFGITDNVAKEESKIGNNVNRKAAKKPRIMGEWSADAAQWRVDTDNSKVVGKKLASEVYDNGAVNLPGPSNAQGSERVKKPGKESKPQIISDETVLGDLMIISRLPGTRIQRTVNKQIPKQNIHEGIVNSDESSAMETQEVTEERGKKRAARHEVIEISDDEIEELPRKLSRMELLNLIPNVISESYTFEPISQRYLPKNVSPQITAAKLSRWKTRWREVKNAEASPRVRENDMPGGMIASPVQNWGAMLPPGGSRMPWLSSRILERTSFSSWTFRSRNGFYGEQNRIESLTYSNHQSVVNRASFHQRSILSNPSCFYWRQNSAWRGFPRWQQRSSIGSERAWESSFKVVPGATSWSETKETWLKDRTISIEDEEPGDSMAEEVEVVMQPPKPLVGSSNATSLSQVYKRLQIIKEAPSGLARHLKKRRELDYRISYNLYSTGQPYKKTNPGPPMYRIVVFRLEDTPFIELADISQLQSDAKETPIIFACVSHTSVTFAEFGKVAIPEIQAIA